jgi:hypothetical protein
MNFPTSQTSPDGFNSLPPNQKRRIRLIIHSASAAEIDSFLHDDLQPKTALNPLYFVMLALSALLLATALLADSPLLLLAALLCAPFNAPLMGLTLSAVIPSGGLCCVLLPRCCSRLQFTLAPAGSPRCCLPG